MALRKAEAGPTLSLLRISALHSTSIASIAASRLFTQINQFRLIVVFLCECTIYDWLYMDFVCEDLEMRCHLTVHLSPKAY